LVGNPYPSPLDWDLAQAANSGVVEAALYRRIPKGALNIVTWSKYIPGTGSTVEGGTVGGNAADTPANVDKDIALGQGFFVVAKGNGNLTFTNAMRPTVATQTNPLFLRSENDKTTLRSENDKPMSIKFRFQSTEYYDEMLIHFKEKATEKYDGDFDAHKAPTNAGTMPDIFMVSADNKNLSINGLPFSTLQKSILFIVQSKTAGEYQIKIQQAMGVPVGTNIILWDKELNKKQNLSLNPIYKFTAKVATYNKRFELIFDMAIDGDKVGNLAIYPNPVTDSKATLRLQTNNAATLQIVVYDITGRIIKNLSATKELNTFETSIDMSEIPQGIYVVEVTDGKGKYVTKFVK
jgi:hypothetical protein